MRKHRKLVGLVAIVAVLMHAALLVWHNTSVLRDAVAGTVFGAALQSICHNGSPSPNSAWAIPGAPGSTDENPEIGCPMCKGVVGAVAILGTHTFDLGTPPPATQRLIAVAGAVAQRLTHAWPPSRAPPAALV